jgi:hypothetical protein
MSESAWFTDAQIFTSRSGNYTYYNFKNFKNKNVKSGEEIVLDGNYFVLYPDDYLWHFISEALTQYELLLKEVPDLKLLFVALGNQAFEEPVLTIKEFMEKLKKVDHYNNLAYMEDIFKVYYGENYSQEKIYNFYKSNLTITNCYMIFDLRRLINRGSYVKANIGKPYWLQGKHKKNPEGNIIFESDHAPWSNLSNNLSSWEKDGMKLIRERFKNFVQEKDLPQKIYIDRSDANKKYREYINSDPNLKQRYFSKEYHIKDYFVNNGYTPIVMTDYGYIDQLNFYYNATHIAGMCGTGMLGGFISKPNTKIMQIYVDNLYNFSYSYLTEIAPVDIISIDLRSCYDGKNLFSNFKVILDRYKKAGFING